MQYWTFLSIYFWQLVTNFIKYIFKSFTCIIRYSYTVKLGRALRSVLFFERQTSIIYLLTEFCAQFLFSNISNFFHFRRYHFDFCFYFERMGSYCFLFHCFHGINVYTNNLLNIVLRISDIWGNTHNIKQKQWELWFSLVPWFMLFT